MGAPRRREMSGTVRDERDAEIAACIRREIAKVEDDKERLRYPTGSPDDACLQGKINGLRAALAFVDLHPQS